MIPDDLNAATPDELLDAAAFLQQLASECVVSGEVENAEKLRIRSALYYLLAELRRQRCGAPAKKRSLDFAIVAAIIAVSVVLGACLEASLQWTFQ